jgi:hypothetical protein
MRLQDVFSVWCETPEIVRDNMRQIKTTRVTQAKNTGLLKYMTDTNP